jgi:hypothetical protein
MANTRARTDPHSGGRRPEGAIPIIIRIIWNTGTQIPVNNPQRHALPGEEYPVKKPNAIKRRAGTWTSEAPMSKNAIIRPANVEKRYGQRAGFLYRRIAESGIYAAMEWKLMTVNQMCECINVSP